MAYSESKTTTWNRSTANDGLLFDAEFTRLYANFTAIVNNGGSAPTRDMEALSSAIDSLIGTVRASASATPESDELLCDGSAISRTTYSALFAKIGETWGVGDGATTFNIPDLRGAFLRGTGSHGTNNMANGNDFAGPALGAFENDQLQGHVHATALAWSAGFSGTYLQSSSKFAATGNALVTATTPYTLVAASDGTNGTPRTGDETRPFAAGVKFYIKVI